MSGVISLSEQDLSATALGEPSAAGPQIVPHYVRTAGAVRCRFAVRPRGTEAIELSETGGFRVRFPRVGPCEAVLINTGGGLTGGDSLNVQLALDEGADAIATTQSAEKVYRAQAAPTRVSVIATLGPASRLTWLPQETILFSGARLSRRFDVDMHECATLTMAESIVFGRLAMGEVVQEGLIEDRWRIRRGGRLAFAENMCMDGPIAAMLDRPALGGGARAVATVLHIASDAESRLDEARAALELASSDCGASAWSGMLVLRFAAAQPSLLRADVARFLNQFRAGPLPRVWQC